MTSRPQSRLALALVATASTLILLGHFSTPQQVQAQAQPDVNAIVQKLVQAQQANHDRMRAYTLTRRYAVFDTSPESPKSEVVARVNFLPPDAKTYQIEKSSGGISERVIRHILDHEVQMARTPSEIALTPENYEFALAGEESKNGHDCWVLELHPREKDKDLLQGKAWVDKQSFNVVHMEGSPAKNPSFWVKDVRVTLNFGDVEGLWLQTSMQANAHVRFGGNFNIASRDLDHETASTVAENRAIPFRGPRNTRRGSSAAPFLASGIAPR